MLNENDLELLSAYLDGALSDEERAALEARLQSDADLRRELDRLRATVALIKTLPTLSAPRLLTLTPRMVRRPSILTSAAFSALSAAAAVILLVIGAALFTTTSAPRSPAARQVAALPTFQSQTESQSVNEPQSAEANNAVQPPVVADNLQVTLAKGTTQVGQEAAGGSNFAAAATETPLPTVAALLYAAPLPTDTFGAEDLQADGSVSPAQQGEETAIDQQRTQADMAAPSAMSGVASAAQAPLPAPTLALPTATLVPTETATSRPSETPSPTNTATLTSTPSPTASATPTPIPTPVPAEAPAPDNGIVGISLIVVALLLFGFAIVTTILRRRS